MGCVMIRCPVTGRAVSTGIDTELATLEQAIPFRSSIQCAACGTEHGWTRADAWICETVPFESPNAA